MIVYVQHHLVDLHSTHSLTTFLQITQLEAALSHSHSKTSTSAHPLLMSGFIDGGMTATASTSPHAALPALTHSSISPDTQSTSLRIDTPPTSTSVSLSEPRSGSHSRMAVESLLLSQDVAGAAAPEGRKDAEWVSENAAPAFIVSFASVPDGILSSGHHAETSIRLARQCQRIIMPSRGSSINSKNFIACYLPERKPTKRPYSSLTAPSGCTSSLHRGVPELICVKYQYPSHDRIRCSLRTGRLRAKRI